MEKSLQVFGFKENNLQEDNSGCSLDLKSGLQQQKSVSIFLSVAQNKDYNL